MTLCSISEAIEDLQAGRMIILVDDPDRENEGDVVMLAEHVTPEAINFMAKEARGLICMPLDGESCDRLGLDSQAQRNTNQHETAFTISIEAAKGVTTGISAADRSKTIEVAARADCKPEDLARPGHVFPLRAKDGGVLVRGGQTEGSVDLAKLAGARPAAVICEIMNDDGSMSRRPELEEFAKQHDIKIGTIADLIHYRLLNERTVERVDEQVLSSELGQFNLVAYRDRTEDLVHLALTLGTIEPEEPTLVRVHNVDPLRDLFLVPEAGRWSLQEAMRRVAAEGRGVVLMLGNQVDSAALLEHVSNLGTGNAAARRPSTYNTVGAGSQILRDLGVRKMRLLSSPMKFNAISGFDLEVVEYLPCD